MTCQCNTPFNLLVCYMLPVNTFNLPSIMYLHICTFIYSFMFFLTRILLVALKNKWEDSRQRQGMISISFLSYLPEGMPNDL